MLEGARSELCSRTECHCTLCTCGVRMSPALSRTCAPNIADLNWVNTHLGTLQERVYHSRKFDTVDHLKQAIVLE